MHGNGRHSPVLHESATGGPGTNEVMCPPPFPQGSGLDHIHISKGERVLTAPSTQELKEKESSVSPGFLGKMSFVWRTGRVHQGPGKVKKEVTSHPAWRGSEESGWISRACCQSEKSIQYCLAKEVF